ncbi:helix-turn-helix domain-containing protein [Chitinophaga arvensicola]|uniref:DNA-binding transcriptional regulator, XRE-family HTH domain n=1 Tax=Chitinophaga arvensicola TaxID=29529 RepID=A0A1I0S4Z1_9BACT|nr:helix-turn-helix transcriptional regulator [Chitinophaga arvensicola]SEW49743.1 DNA-binding transcriptional regulator, XRE-family HTH domain [Chitinophaga arvensicola]
MRSKEQILIDFGNRLRKIRTSRELTQMDVAVKVDSYPNYISKLESGKSEPGLFLIIALANALNVPVKELMEDQI